MSGEGDVAVAAVILAAGRGSRFGREPKLLAELDGKPLLRHVAQAALASQARPVLAVVGAEAERVGEALAGLDLQLVPNPRFAEGLSTSLKAGFAALPRAAEAAIVLLGDMPLVTCDTIDRLIVEWRAGKPATVVPTWHGRRGNPVLLSRVLQPEIEALKGDRGAGPILADRLDVRELALADPSILADVDTPAALEELRAARVNAPIRGPRPGRSGSSR